jgi:hypothetical protein
MKFIIFLKTKKTMFFKKGKMHHHAPYGIKVNLEFPWLAPSFYIFILEKLHH